MTTVNLEEWFVCDQNTYNEQRLPLISFHLITGGDYTSSFFCKGKITSLNKACVKPNFVVTLPSILGNQDTLDDETFNTLEEYTCCSYGSNRKNINKLRFQKFTQKYERGEKYVHLAMLPLCRSSLLLYTQQANWAANLMKSKNTYNSSRANPSRLWLGCKWHYHLSKWTLSWKNWWCCSQRVSRIWWCNWQWRFRWIRIWMGRCKWRLCTKGFRKFVWHLYEAFLNLIKHFQMLSNYNTAISFFVDKHSWNINTQYLNFCNPGRIFSSLFLIGSLLNFLATE